MENYHTVYMHTSPSGKVYIGITSMDPPERRYADGRGYGKSTIFGKAIQKYGWNNFNHSIHYLNLTEYDAKEKERKLIAQFKSQERRYGYNMSAGGDGTFGVKLSDERKERLRLMNTGEGNPFYGRKHSDESKAKIKLHHANISGENHPNYGKKLSDIARLNMKKHHANVGGTNNPNWGKGKHVMQIDTINGIPIKSFTNANQASRETGINRNCIAWCCDGKHKLAGGYIWEYI